MGSIYRRKFKDKDNKTREGKTFWIRYQHNGKPVYESAKSTKWADATRLLKLREGEIAAGKALGNRYDKVMVKELTSYIAVISTTRQAEIDKILPLIAKQRVQEACEIPEGVLDTEEIPEDYLLE
jgi:hypothetical protein